MKALTKVERKRARLQSVGQRATVLELFAKVGKPSGADLHKILDAQIQASTDLKQAILDYGEESEEAAGLIAEQLRIHDLFRDAQKRKGRN